MQSLTTSAGGTASGGNVVWYRFDEAKGDVAVDSSGHGRNGTIVPVTTDWTLVQDGGGSATASLDSGTPLNDQLDEVAAPGRHLGRGRPAGRHGQRRLLRSARRARPDYRVSFFAKASDRFSGPLTVSLETADGSQTFASTQVSGLTPTWKRFTATLRVPAGVSVSTGNRFVIGIDNRGHHVAPVPTGTSVWLQVVSLFPPTYRNRPNGLRPDLVDLVRAMGPKILRFPGGNYVEGVTVDTRWDWKKTIGPVWERPGHQNSAWGYWSDDGLGLLEYLQLAEDLGATPVMAVWAGSPSTAPSSPRPTWDRTSRTRWTRSSTRSAR